MEALNQNIFSCIAYAFLMLCYGLTFATWIKSNNNLRPIPKWIIFGMICYIGSSKTLSFYNGDNIADIWFIAHPALCLLFLMIIRGYRLYIADGVGNRFENLKDIFSGNPYKYNRKEKVKIGKESEPPQMFIWRFVAVAFVCLLILYSMFSVDTSLTKNQNRKLTNKLEIITDSLKTSKEENQKKNDFVIKLIKQADRDSVNFNIEIKENEN